MFNILKTTVCARARAYLRTRVYYVPEIELNSLHTISHLTLQWPYWIGTLMIPILWVIILRFRELKILLKILALVNVNSGIPTPQPELRATLEYYFHRLHFFNQISWAQFNQFLILRVTINGRGNTATLSQALLSVVSPGGCCPLLAAWLPALLLSICNNLRNITATLAKPFIK